MGALGAVIAKQIARWETNDLALERLVFGTVDADEIAAIVDRWCREHLDAAIDHYVFFDSSSGSVHGVVLADGRGVVVKMHRPGIARHYIDASVAVQRILVARGVRGPEPLVDPQPFGSGHVTAEAMLGPYPKLDAHAPSVRDVLAAGLAQFVAVARDVPTETRTHPMTTPTGALYPEPHSPRFDFAATAAGAEWIDELMRAAREQLARLGDQPRTMTHGDWRIDNVRVIGDEIVAVYDWESVGPIPETEAVAAAARTFSVDWDRDDVARFPDAAAMAAFIGAYERARGTPLTRREREHTALTMVASMAYGARCEHSIRWPEIDDSQQRQLRTLGPALLRDGLDALGAPR
jgi:Ser/Thr protein kinase RdoA (MazF antagonist)